MNKFYECALPTCYKLLLLHESNPATFPLRQSGKVERLQLHLPLLCHPAMYPLYHMQILDQIHQTRIFLTSREEHIGDALE